MSLNLKKYGSDLIEKWNRFVEIKEENSWLLFGFEGQTFNLIHFGSGNCGIEELLEELSDGTMMYGAICVKDPNSNSHKIIFIIWQGQSVSSFIKYKVETFNETVKKFFKGYTCDITARSEKDLSIDLIKNKAKLAVHGNYSTNENKSEIKVERRATYSHANFWSGGENKTSTEKNVQAQPQTEKYNEPPKFDGRFNSVRKLSGIWMKESSDTIHRSNHKDQTKSYQPPSSNFNKVSQREDRPLSAVRNSEKNTSSFSGSSNCSTRFQTNNKAPSSDKYSVAKRNEQTSSQIENFQSNTNLYEDEFRLSVNVESNQKRENRNSFQALKDGRKKEMDEMINKSKVSEMRDQLKANKTLCFSYPNVDSKSETQTSAVLKSTETPSKIPKESPKKSENKDSRTKLPKGAEKKSTVPTLHSKQSGSKNVKTTSNISTQKQREYQSEQKLKRNSRAIGGSSINARVLYNYDAEDDDELSIKQNEILTIVEKGEDWWIAINSKGNRGNVPANYVETIDQKKSNISKLESEDDHRADNTLPARNNSYHINESKSTDYLIHMVSSRSYNCNEKDGPTSTGGNEKWSNEAGSICKTDNIKPNYETSNKKATEFPKYIASFSYAKVVENELNFEENDILSIIDANDSGWWLAKNMAGEQGLVPFNYLVEL